MCPQAACDTPRTGAGSAAPRSSAPCQQEEPPRAEGGGGGRTGAAEGLWGLEVTQGVATVLGVYGSSAARTQCSSPTTAVWKSSAILTGSAQRQPGERRAQGAREDSGGGSLQRQQGGGV